MSQTPAEASGGHPVKPKFQPKPPNRRSQEERDRIQKKAEEELRQKLERERKNNIPCRFYWFDNGLGDCKKGDSCDYSHKVMPEWLKRRVESQNPDRCNKYNSWEYNSDKEGRNPKRPKLSTNAEPKERAPDFDEQQVKGGQVRNGQNPSTPKCRYYNTYGGCKKGEDCLYQHIDLRPPPPPLKDKTTWSSLDEERVLKREENIQGNDPDLWNVILDERVRLQRDMEQAKENGDFDDLHRKELDEIKIDDIKDALSGWQGRSVSSKVDGVDHEDHRGDFDEIFASIHKQLPNYLQQAVIDNCVDQIIWKSLSLRTRQLFVGKSFNDLSRYVLKSDPWIALSLLNSLLDLSDARTEKGKGWYLGVVSTASGPVEEDYLRLYVGQSTQIARRIRHHLQHRYTRESFQYQTTRRSDKHAQYVTLGVIPAEGLEHETQRVLLNYGELLLCLFFQTLPQMQLPRYLPQEAIREPWIGLNCQNPMQQGVRGRLSQAPDSAWASKDVPEAVRAKRQENMNTIYYLHYVMGKREAFGTYIWARDADLRHEDDPSILVQCGRCKGQPRRDLAPLYARDGSGYILRQGRCNDCRSLGKEIARLPRFYPIDPRVPYIQMSRLKAEYMRSHPELEVADIEYEDAEVFTNKELDEAKQVYRESLNKKLEDVYL